MRELSEKYKIFKNQEFIISVGIGLLVFIGSFFVNYYAGMYATEHVSNSVTDIILNNIPVFDVGGIFIYGPLVLWVFVALVLLQEPKSLPFVLKSLTLFILIRSLFITLTHIGPFPDQMSFTTEVPNLLQNFMFGGDLFFSGHTGSPFLMALMFWENKMLRFIFLASAVLFALVVLMAHLHYSIDVLSAFFITYTIFHLSKKIFKKDYSLLVGEQNV